MNRNLRYSRRPRTSYGLSVMAAIVGGALVATQLPCQAYITTATQGQTAGATADGNRAVSNVYDNGPTPGDGSAQGNPSKFSWSIMPDGTSMGTKTSDTVSSWDAAYGVAVADQVADLTLRPWFTPLEDALALISNRCGVTYIYEPNDDGIASYLYYTIAEGDRYPGVAGVRGDLRFAASADLAAGGFSSSSAGALYHPDTYLRSTHSTDSAIRFVFGHETLHALGFNHSTVNGSSSQSAVTGQGGTSNGPQFDDIYGLHRKYGDFYEKDGGNDTQATATDIGSLSIGGSVIVGDDADDTTVALNEFDFISIDDDSDTDYLKFTLNDTSEVTVTLDPRGPTYTNYGTDWTATSIANNTVTIVASENSDLAFVVRDSSGAIVSAESSAGVGVAETSTLTLPAGDYYAEITGDANDTQLYSFEVKSTDIARLPAPCAHWPMDEGSGTEVVDISGNGYHGTITNTSNWATGILGGGLSFDVNADKVDVPAAPFAALTTEASFSFWAYGSDDQPTASYPFRSYDSNGGNKFVVYLTAGAGHIIYENYENNGASNDRDRLVVQSSELVESDYKGVWNHWVITNNATTGVIKMYLNGSLWATDSGNVKTLEGTVSACIGRSYNGELDDFILYCEELSADQIAELYLNNPPVAMAQSLATDAQVALAIALSGTDADGNILEYSVDQSPANGVVSGTAPNLIYTPNAGFSGTDTFTYYVNDGFVNSYPQTVSVEVGLSGYALWLSQNTVLSDGGFNADPDGDGLVNGLEYMLAGDPAEHACVLPATDYSTGDAVITFDRNAESTVDTTQVLQYSADLESWTDVSLTDDAAILAATDTDVSVGTAVSGVEAVTVTINASVISGEKFFWRLFVELNE